MDASDNRQVTVRVIMDNRELNLLDRSAATAPIRQKMASEARGSSASCSP